MNGFETAELLVTSQEETKSDKNRNGTTISTSPFPTYENFIIIGKGSRLSSPMIEIVK